MPHGIVRQFKTNLPAYAVTALGKLQAFAIQYVETKVREVLAELLDQCPPPDRLEKLSNSVNNVRSTVARINTQINSVGRIASYLDPVLIGAQVYIEFQKHRIDFIANPINGPVGSPTFAKTSGKINSMASRLRRFEDLVDTVEEAQFAIKAAVGVTQGIFIPVESTLDLIDSLIQRCATGDTLSEEERKNLVTSIQAKTQEIYRQGIQYRSTTGRTYTIKVVNDPNSPSFAPKRQAIAQDFRGITVLTGPSSFASNPQVLVDEIKFRIDNQLP